MYYRDDNQHDIFSRVTPGQHKAILIRLAGLV